MKSETKPLHLKSFILSFLGLISIAQAIAPAGLFIATDINQLIDTLSTKLSADIHIFKGISNTGRHTALFWPNNDMRPAPVTFGSEKALNGQKVGITAPAATENAVYVTSYKKIPNKFREQIINDKQ